MIAIRAPEPEAGGSGGAPRPPLMDVEETAEFLRTSTKAIYHRIERGQLPSVRIGRRVLIRRRDLLTLIAEGRGPSPRSR